MVRNAIREGKQKMSHYQDKEGILDRRTSKGKGTESRKVEIYSGNVRKYYLGKISRCRRMGVSEKS